MNTQTKGQTIVTLHGFGFDRRIWLPVELAFEGRHVVHLDLPGFGGAEVIAEYSLDQLAKAYWHKLDAAGVNEPHLIGHSMGGYVAMAMAATRPGALGSLSLVHSHVFPDSDDKKRARDLTIAGIEKHGRRFIIDKMIPTLFGDPDQHERLIGLLIDRAAVVEEAAWIAGTAAMRDRLDHRDTLAALRCPVHIVLGLLDQAVPAALGFQQASLAERTMLSVYPDAGHLAMYEATPQLLNDIARFLANCNR